MHPLAVLGFFGLGTAELLVIFVVLGLLLIPQIFYLLTLSRTLQACAEHNRKMQPGEVWLVFIPLFGIVWHFIVVNRVADTLAAEFRMRQIPVQEERPGHTLGMWFLILGVLGWLPFLGGLISLAGLVLWILYWVKIAGYKTKLETHQFQFGQGNPYVFPNQFPNQYGNQNPNPYQSPNPYQNPNQFPNQPPQ